MAARKKKKTKSFRAEVIANIKRADAAERAARIRKAKPLQPVRGPAKKAAKARQAETINKHQQWLLDEQERRRLGKTPRRTRRRAR